MWALFYTYRASATKEEAVSYHSGSAQQVFQIGDQMKLLAFTDENLEVKYQFAQLRICFACVLSGFRHGDLARKKWR